MRKHLLITRKHSLITRGYLRSTKGYSPYTKGCSRSAKRFRRSASTKNKNDRVGCKNRLTDSIASRRTLRSSFATSFAAAVPTASQIERRSHPAKLCIVLSAFFILR